MDGREGDVDHMNAMAFTSSTNRRTQHIFAASATAATMAIVLGLLLRPTVRQAAAAIENDWPHEIANRRVAESVANVISSSRGIISTSPDKSGPVDDVVLWLADGGDAGRMEWRDMAVLSHSPLRRALVLYRWPDASEVPPERQMELQRRGEQTVSPDRRGSASLSERFRRDPLVSRAVVAHGVSWFRLEPIGAGPNMQSKVIPLRLTLIWPGEAADTTDQASLVIHGCAVKLQEN